MDVAVRYFRSLRLFHWAIFAAVAVSVFTVTYHQVTEAACYQGRVLGRSCYRGYFTNREDTGGTNVLPPIRNGLAIPHNINTATELYNLLRSAYNSNSAQRRTGAAFIYNTMMGYNAPGTGRSVSNAEWNDFFQRLKALDDAGRVDWRGNVSASINSYWQGVQPDGRNNDDAYYRQYKNEAGILIRDYDGNVIYKILRRCANPVGDSDGLPNPEPQDYRLTPRVDSVSPSTVEAGSKMSVRTSVDNVGDVRSMWAQWEITQMTVLPGKLAPHENQNGTTSETAPCQDGGGAASGNYFQSADSNCKNVAKGEGRFNLGTPAQNIKPSADGLDVDDLPVGMRICFALSVQPYSNESDDWAHSKPICTVVGKKPKVQIWGGDINVRGKIETSTSVKSQGGNRTFGSWVEYGSFSVGTNVRFASGSGLSRGNANNQQTAWSRLTFANRDEAGGVAFGNYTTATNFPPLSNVAEYFGAVQDKVPVGSGSASLDGLTFATGGPVRVRTAGNLTVTGGNIPAGRSVVIVASGTVTIDGNITYTDADLGSLRDIPQVVIIADNIRIRDNVTRIDAWLVTSGTLNTCYNFSGNLTSEKCNAGLEVNGPVVTGRLLLNRTGGSGTGGASGDPAERFNLRPDAYLWAQLQAQGNSKAQTVYTVELPPRF